MQRRTFLLGLLGAVGAAAGGGFATSARAAPFRDLGDAAKDPDGAAEAAKDEGARAPDGTEIEDAQYYRRRRYGRRRYYGQRYYGRRRYWRPRRYRRPYYGRRYYRRRYYW